MSKRIIILIIVLMLLVVSAVGAEQMTCKKYCTVDWCGTEKAKCVGGTCACSGDVTGTKEDCNTDTNCDTKKCGSEAAYCYGNVCQCSGPIMSDEEPAAEKPKEEPKEVPQSCKIKCAAYPNAAYADGVCTCLGQPSYKAGPDLDLDDVPEGGCKGELVKMYGTCVATNGGCSFSSSCPGGYTCLAGTCIDDDSYEDIEDAAKKENINLEDYAPNAQKQNLDCSMDKQGHFIGCTIGGEGGDKASFSLPGGGSCEQGTPGCALRDQKGNRISYEWCVEKFGDDKAAEQQCKDQVKNAYYGERSFGDVMRRVFGGIWEGLERANLLCSIGGVGKDFWCYRIGNGFADQMAAVEDFFAWEKHICSKWKDDEADGAGAGFASDPSLPGGGAAVRGEKFLMASGAQSQAHILYMITAVVDPKNVCHTLDTDPSSHQYDHLDAGQKEAKKEENIKENDEHLIFDIAMFKENGDEHQIDFNKDGQGDKLKLNCSSSFGLGTNQYPALVRRVKENYYKICLRFYKTPDAYENGPQANAYNLNPDINGLKKEGDLKVVCDLIEETEFEFDMDDEEVEDALGEDGSDYYSDGTMDADSLQIVND